MYIKLHRSIIPPFTGIQELPKLMTSVFFFSFLLPKGLYFSSLNFFFNYSLFFARYMPMPHETGDIPVKQMYFYRQNHWTTSSLKEYYRDHSINPCKVIVNLESIKETGTTPTAPCLIIWIIGHKVSSMKIGWEHKRNIHDPMNDSLRLRSKLY